MQVITPLTQRSPPLIWVMQPGGHWAPGSRVVVVAQSHVVVVVLVVVVVVVAQGGSSFASFEQVVNVHSSGPVGQKVGQIHWHSPVVVVLVDVVVVVLVVVVEQGSGVVDGGSGRPMPQHGLAVVVVVGSDVVVVDVEVVVDVVVVVAQPSDVRCQTYTPSLDTDSNRQVPSQPRLADPRGVVVVDVTADAGEANMATQRPA
jgi:hypothetical protein